MEKVMFTNSRNESVVFSYSLPPYKIMSVEGLGGLENTINSEKAPMQDGETFLNSTTDVRRPSFDILIMSDDIQSKRREILKVLNPTLGMGTLKYLYNETEIKSIKCKVETAPNFINNSKYPANRFLPFQFTLYCPNPYWEDNIKSQEEMKAFLNKFKFPLKFPTQMGGEGSRIKINNDGDVPTPVKITFTGASTNPKIINETTGEFIKIEKELLSNDVLTINTEFGNKRIEINGQNAFSYISNDSVLWLLDIGENTISYQTDTGAKNAYVVIEWVNKYIGI